MRPETIINRFLNSQRKSGKSILTLSAYATDLKQFCSLAPPVSLAAFTPSQLSSCCRQLTTGLASNSCARKLTTIREFLRWAYASGYVQNDIAGSIVLPRRSTVRPAKPLSLVQLARLRRAADVRERLLLELLLQTGMKLTDAVSVRMKHLVSLRSAISLPGRAIRIPLTPSLRQALNQYLASTPRGPKSTLLANSVGHPLSIRTASTMLAALARHSGVRHATARDLRTTFIVRQLEAGTPVAVIQHLVGHGNSVTTQRYLPAAESLSLKSPLKLFPL